MHIHPMVVTSCSLLMRNKQPAMLSAEGEQIPTRAQTPRLEAAQGDPGQGGCKGLVCLDLSLHTEPPPCTHTTALLLWGTGPSLGSGQEGSQSLSHWEGTARSGDVASVGRTEDGEEKGPPSEPNPLWPIG